MFSSLTDSNKSQNDYKLITFTGVKPGAGTKSKVYVILYGDNGNTDEQQLKRDDSSDTIFESGK